MNILSIFSVNVKFVPTGFLKSNLSPLAPSFAKRAAAFMNAWDDDGKDNRTR